jgi:hypothetical protein
MPSVADPDPVFEIRCFFDLWIRDGEKYPGLLDPGSGILNKHPQSASLPMPEQDFLSGIWLFSGPVTSFW